MNSRAIALLALFVIAAPPALASGPGPTPWDTCFAKAGAYYSINPLLLKAIARQESSMNPAAVGQNTNGTQDIGLMQINTTHMPKLRRAGLDRQKLLDPCTSIAVGAWVLADAVSRNGMTWKAVGVYHSPTPWRQRDYAAKIQRHLMREIAAAQPAMPAAVTASSAAGYGDDSP